MNISVQIVVLFGKTKLTSDNTEFSFGSIFFLEVVHIGMRPYPSDVEHNSFEETEYDLQKAQEYLHRLEKDPSVSVDVDLGEVTSELNEFQTEFIEKKRQENLQLRAYEFYTDNPEMVEDAFENDDFEAKEEMIETVRSRLVQPYEYDKNEVYAAIIEFYEADMEDELESPY